MATSLQPGDRAPDFAGPTADGRTVRLADFAGRWLALYAYPADATPGCTAQACNLRDGTDALEAAGVAVVGLSPDGVESHARFAAAHDLPFPLVADPGHEILTAYGVWGEKTLYGRKSIGVTRTTFLIDPEGVIRHVFRRPKTAAHTEEILARLDALR